MEENQDTRGQGLNRAQTSKRGDPPHHCAICWLEVSYFFLRTPLTSDAVALSLSRVEPHLRYGKLATSYQVDDQHAKTYVCGLLSDIEHKNIASIAYRFGQSRLPLQGFIGWHEWDDEPLRQELRSQVKTHLGQGDGVLVFDPSGFPKSGCESVGVARQWCGRLGKVDNCQVAMYLGYARVRATPWWTHGSTCPKNGPRTRPVSTKLAFRKGTEATARVTRWPWRGWQKTAPVFRIAGWPVTTKWDAPIGFGVGLPPEVSGMCWPCRRTRRYVIWRSAPCIERPGASAQAALAQRRGVESIACG